MTIKIRKKHPYYMYDSIINTPDYLKNCLEKRVIDQIMTIANVIHERKIKRLIVVGCGTSMLIAETCKHFFGYLTDITVITDSAFELLNYSYLKLQDNDAVLGISHTGGTKAVVDYLRSCQSKGILTFGLFDVEDSRLQNVSDLFILGPGGKDHAIPKTRSFSTGVFICFLLAKEVAKLKGTVIHIDEQLIIHQVSKTIEETEQQVLNLIEKWKDLKQFVIVGSGTNYITSKEGSLKIMETANTVSFGIQVEELAHGNELYLNDQFGVFIIAPNKHKSKERLQHIIEATILTEAKVCLIYNDNIIVDENPNTEKIKVSQVNDELVSIFNFILPLQLFAYYLAINNGAHPDLVSTVNENMKKAIVKYHPPGYH